MSNGIKDLTSRADTALDKATDYSDSLAALAVALNPGTSAGQDVFDIGLGGINILRSLLKGEGVPKKELARSGFGILGLLPFISGAATRRGRQALADLYNPIERGTGGGRSRAEFPEKFDKPDPYRPDVTGKNPLSEHDYEHWGYPKTKIEEPEPLTPQLRKVADESEDLGLGPRETSFGEELEGGSSYFGQRQLDRMRNAEARVIEEAERLRTKELEAIDLSTDPDMGPVRRVTVEAGEQKTLPGFIKPFRTKGYRSINRRIGQQLLPNGNFVERLRANKNLTAEEKIKIFNEEADYILKNYGEKYHKIFTEGFVHKPTRGGHTRADIIFEAMHGQKLIPSEYDAFMKEASTITQSGKSLSPLQRRLIRQKREAVAEKAGVEYQPVQRKKISRDQERLERRERLEREIKYKKEGLPLNFMEKKPEASHETIDSILSFLEDVPSLGIKRLDPKGRIVQPTKVHSQAMPHTLSTGNAPLSDQTWQRVAKKYGVSNIRVYNPEHMINNPERRAEAGVALKKASNNIPNKYPITSGKNPDFSNALLERNYFQVKNSDGVFAVGKRTKNQKGLGIEGGSAWAVQMGIDQGKPVYVFDVVSNKWFTGDNTFVRGMDTPPTLTPNFTGIGATGRGNKWKEGFTREEKARVVNAIEDVFRKSTTPETTGEFPPGLVKSVRKGLSELYEELGFHLPTSKRDVVPFEEFLERFQGLDQSEQIKYLSKYLKQTGKTETKEELLRVSARKYKRKDPMEGKIDLEREERIANRIALRQNINRALQDNHGDIGGAAKSLGMSPKELEGHMNRIRLSDTITRTRKP